MFTSATGYIFSFGLSRRRHEPPFKPGGSVGALVGRPGFRAGFARIRARGRGRGSVGAACSSRKKPLDLQSSYHLIYSLARPPRCAAAPCSPAYCVFPTTWCANDGTVDSTTSTPVIESTATSSFSGILPLKHVRSSYAPQHGARRQGKDRDPRGREGR